MRSPWMVLLAALAVLCGPATAQESTAPAPSRPLVRSVPPSYPDLARRLSLTGTVRLIVTVAPGGSVKSVQPMGGNPVLIKAAQDAVTNWKYATAPGETKEVVELRFSPR